MKKFNVGQISSSIIKYLDLINTDLFKKSGWFNDEEDEKKINELGFNVELFGFYDGKILKVTDKHIATHSTKCQCFHAIYLKDKSYKRYVFEFHVVEEDRRWSTDPVYDLIKKDDSIENNYVVINTINNETIVSDLNKEIIPQEIKQLFFKLKKHINDNYKDLRLRLIIEEKNK